MLKEVAVETIVDEVTEISAHLKEFGVNQKEIFSVILSADVKTACKKENGDWEIPSVMGVEGKLVDLTPQGLLFHGDKT